MNSELPQSPQKAPIDDCRRLVNPGFAGRERHRVPVEGARRQHGAPRPLLAHVAMAQDRELRRLECLVANRAAEAATEMLRLAHDRSSRNRGLVPARKYHRFAPLASAKAGGRRGDAQAYRLLRKLAWQQQGERESGRAGRIGYRGSGLVDSAQRSIRSG